MDDIEYVCVDCGKPCGLYEETFDYSGTHCTGGIAGTHHTGHYLSDCCGDGYKEYVECDEDEGGESDGRP